MIVTMRRTYSYKLYATDRTKYLDGLVDISCQIWNHCLALQRRYYKLTGKYIPANRMKLHITRLKRLPKYSHWRALGSQAAQDVVERLDRSYQSFFQWCKTKSGGRKSPPKFRKHKKYRSFTLKQAGWSIDGNVIVICRRRFKFFKHRDFHGDVKTVTIKRNALGEYFVYLSVVEDVSCPDTHTGNAVGADFGLKTFMTLSDGTRIQSPQWLLSDIDLLRKASRDVSRKKRGSNNRRRALMAYERLHEDIANRRKDWFFRLASELTQKYASITIEDLDLAGMMRLWGRKVSDLAYGEFVQILSYEATLHGCNIIVADRWYPSSKTCHCCGHVNHELSLKDRVWQCPSCGTVLDRDENAAINLLVYGMDRTEEKSSA